MPTLSPNIPGLARLLGEMAKKHCRTLDQEATFALRLYIAEGADTERLPNELVAKAHEPGDCSEPCQLNLPQDVCLPLWKLAEQHERSPGQEAAWGILW
jgi:hypothetical protein